MWDGDRKEHTDPQDRNADASNKEGLLQTPRMALVAFQLPMESRARAQTLNLQVDLPCYGQIWAPFILPLRKQAW